MKHDTHTIAGAEGDDETVTDVSSLWTRDTYAAATTTTNTTTTTTDTAAFMRGG